ncbi:CopG family ribbon-helix-helix protein [Aminobacter sp. BE322]|uniref:CopG family ribbon-helix-helix protein n=1 Tax=unclassified Aminobacter TaxID=2644704 RepID=UPI003D234B18
MPGESTFSIRLPDDLRSEVDEYAKLTKRSRAFVIKEAVATYISDQQAYLAAVREAENEADEGVFVSGARVTDWLASWGTENELPVPEADIVPAQKS